MFSSFVFQASQDEAIRQKDSLESEVKCLRGELQQVRDDRDRQVSQVHLLSAEIAKYNEITGKASNELDLVTTRLKSLEVCGLLLSNYFSLSSFICQIFECFDLMQETCFSQKEQLRLLEHQLVAANEKLKVVTQFLKLIFVAYVLLRIDAFIELLLPLLNLDV